MTTSEIPVQTGYLPVNGLQMYYEIHGTGQPLVLLHGAFSAIGTSFGQLLPGLAQGRQVVAVELQGHGRTADIDRPMTLEVMADDVAAAVDQLGIQPADIFGYSTGAAVALQLVIRHPDAVRKLVLASVTYTLDGVHPGLMEGLGEMTPEMMHGSPWHEEYVRIAPRPEDFPHCSRKRPRWISSSKTCRTRPFARSRHQRSSSSAIPISSAPNTRSRCSACSAVASLETPGRLAGFSARNTSGHLTRVVGEPQRAVGADDYLVS